MSAILIKPEINSLVIDVPQAAATTLDTIPFLIVPILSNQFFLPFSATFAFVLDDLTGWTQMQLTTLSGNSFDNLIGCADENLPISMGAGSPPVSFALSQSNTKKGYTPRADNNVYLYTTSPGSWIFGNPNASIRITLYYKIIQF